MSLKFDRVKEGNLITAKLMNDILTALENLEAKIGTGTSSPGFLSITSVSPQPVSPGQTLAVEGENFGTQNENIILIGGTRVDADKIDTINSSSLTFEVPEIEEGWVWLTICNPTVLGMGHQKIEIKKPTVETKGSIEATITIKLKSGKTKKAGKQPSPDGIVMPGQGPELQDIACDYIEKYLKVTAKQAPLKYVKCKLDIDKQGRNIAVAMFVRNNLAPGSYRVSAQMDGFNTSFKDVEVVTGRKTDTSLTMTPKTQGGKPPKNGKPDIGEKLDHGWYAAADPLYSHTRWPWPPPEERTGFDPVTDPGPEEVEEVEDWLESVADRVQEENPGAPVDRNIKIFMDRSYAPGTVTDQAYAYVVFGDNGAYVPVMLVPKDYADAASVSLIKSALPGVDIDVANKLAEHGINNTAQLASAWSGLVQSALETSPEAAEMTIKTAQAKSKELQGSVASLSGVNTTMEKTLVTAGLDSFVVLANCEAADLSSKMKIDLAFAERLVVEAQARVSESMWSLTRLGLNEGQISALKTKGITTLQSFKNAAAPDVAGALGIGAEQVTNIAKGIDTLEATKTTYSRTVQKSAPVTNVFGITREVGASLARMGIATVGALAEADNAKIAAAFRGSVPLAEAAKKAANKLLE
jgi:predicted flap endonuclease-1-like 5' DNA nuclease